MRASGKLLRETIGHLAIEPWFDVLGAINQFDIPIPLDDQEVQRMRIEQGDFTKVDLHLLMILARYVERSLELAEGVLAHTSGKSQGHGTGGIDSSGDLHHD